MLEKPIEQAVSKYAKQKGWLVYKFKSPSQVGVPDRIFIKNGYSIYIEFKATGKKASELQLRIHQQMREHGALVFVVDNTIYGKKIIDDYNDAVIMEVSC